MHAFTLIFYKDYSFPTIKGKSAWWHHYCSWCNNDVITYTYSCKGLLYLSLIVFLWNNGTCSCNQSLAVDPHQVLTRWIFFTIAGLSTQCVNILWLRGVASSQDYGTERVQQNLTPFCKGIHSLTMLVCTLYRPWYMKAKTRINLLYVWTTAL